MAPKAAVLSPHRQHRTDFTVYTSAACALLAGQDIYEVSNIRDWPYLYPPALAILVAPLACLPPKIAAYLWFLVSLWMWYASGWLLYRTLPEQSPGSTGKAVVWGAVFAGISALDTLGRGQVNLLVLLMACLMLYGLRRRWDLMAGVALGTAASIKIMPILVVTVCGWMWLRDLRRRRHEPIRQRLLDGRFFAGVAIGLAAWMIVLPVVVMGPAKTLEAYASWRAKVGGGYFGRNAQGHVFGDIPHINEFSDKNQSWYRLACMFVIGFDREEYEDVHFVDPSSQRRLFWILGGWFAAQLALACFLAPGRWDRRDELAFYVAPAATFLISNTLGKIAWAHSFVLVMPIATIAAAMLPDVGWSRRTRSERILYVTWIASLIAWLAMYAAPPLLGRINLLLFAADTLIVVTWWVAYRSSSRATNPTIDESPRSV